MRVISGSARGLKLKAPEGMNTRPTLDRIKESLFNIIAADMYDCRFLDLFSGSGAMGIECLSRGGQNAVFVDNNKESIDVIKQNINGAKVQTGQRLCLVMLLQLYQSWHKEVKLLMLFLWTHLMTKGL